MTKKLQRIGLVAIAVIAMIVFGRNVGITQEFENLGQAPDFAGISHWLNSPPLKINELRGKVVLVDFWTYSCINCLRTLPFVTHWYDIYKDKGLVVVGVHTPEFAFEKNTANVEAAIAKLGIHYPVAQDNDTKTFEAFDNHYWPAEYLINQEGRIVLTHFGEGHYDEMETAIRKLLKMDGKEAAVTAPQAPNLDGINSPEMYFGLAREQYQSPAQSPTSGTALYTNPDHLTLNHYALAGHWKLDDEKAVNLDPQATIKLNFSADKVHMVAAAQQPVALDLKLDGYPIPSVTIAAAQLYTLFDGTKPGQHVLEIRPRQPGLEAFTFTFS